VIHAGQERRKSKFQNQNQNFSFLSSKFLQIP
jgi:hypothetical protein